MRAYVLSFFLHSPPASKVTNQQQIKFLKFLEFLELFELFDFYRNFKISRFFEFQIFKTAWKPHHELSLAEKGPGEPVKSKFGATAACFVNFFDFRETFKFFKRLKNVTMSLISKNGSGGAGQKRIWSHGDLFRELFRFLWNFVILACCLCVHAPTTFCSLLLSRWSAFFFLPFCFFSFWFTHFLCLCCVFPLFCWGAGTFYKGRKYKLEHTAKAPWEVRR